jgi:hypothetical protein
MLSEQLHMVCDILWYVIYTCVERGVETPWPVVRPKNRKARQLEKSSDATTRDQTAAYLETG